MCVRCDLTELILRVGIDYFNRELHNQEKKNEFYAGDIDEEEYERSIWPERDLKPPMEYVQVFTPKLTGTGYTH